MVCEKLTLSSKQYLWAVCSLAGGGAVKQVEVAAMVGVSKASVSRAVKKLMQQGLVAEEKDGIAPTPLGRRDVEELAEKWRLVSWKTLRRAALCERDGVPGADGN